MRIIAGKFRSQPILAPPGSKTRPTSDRLRETLFNVLAPCIEGAIFADLYAGTGAVGIEAFSRGARQVYFAENAHTPLTVLRSNLAKFRIGLEAEIEPAGTLALLRAVVRRGICLDIVFLDPPYSDDAGYRTTLKFLATQPCLNSQAIVIVEHARRSKPFSAFGLLEPYRIIHHGEAALTFFRCNSSPQHRDPATDENPS
jgi:16S rRNA (guanine966-N2)-methyltransferase